MTILFHTPYPNTPATLTFQGVTTNLVTSAEGDLFWLEAPDGTHSYTITIQGTTYTGTVTVVGNEGYVDVTQQVPKVSVLIPVLAGGGLLLALYLLFRK